MKINIEEMENDLKLAKTVYIGSDEHLKDLVSHFYKCLEKKNYNFAEATLDEIKNIKENKNGKS